MNKQIVEDFIHAINEHDVDKIYSLMEDRFKFVDTYGNEEIGKDHMKKSWVEYFKWFSDYKIEITDTFANDNVFVILGFASGSYQNKKNYSNENYWRLPAAWKAIVCDHKMKLWQIYCDSKIPFDIIERTNTTGNKNA